MKPKKSEEKMLQSISKDFSATNILEILSTTSTQRLTSLLLNAWKKRCKDIKPFQILKMYNEKSPFFAPSPVSQRVLLKLASECYDAIGDVYKDVQLSPIVPLGANHSITGISQNNVMSTIRNAEVVSDVTMQLALECARLRLKKNNRIGNDIIRLCSFHRVLRMQPFDASQGYMQHFSMFDLCTGGHARNAGRFGRTWIREHISANLDMLSALMKMGYDFRGITVCLSDMKFLEAMIQHFDLPKDIILRNTLNDDFDLFKVCNVPIIREVENIQDVDFTIIKQIGLPNYKDFLTHTFDEVINPLKKQYPSIKFTWDFTRIAGIGYYKPLCFHIFSKRENEECVVLSDGDTVSWLSQIFGSS